MRLLALASATAPAETREQMIVNAAAAGFDGVGLRFDLDPPSDAELVALARRLDSEGLGVVDVEVVRIGNEDPHATSRLIAAAGQLGARTVLVVSDLDDRSATINRYGELCDLATTAGCRATLEFMRFTSVPDLASALEVVAAVNRSGSGVLVDALHLARCGWKLDELVPIAPGVITHVQICDAPATPPPGRVAGLVDEARHARLLPGAGDLALADLLRAIPDVPVSVEVQSDRARAEFAPSDLARRAAAAGRAALAAADQPRSTGYDPQ